MGSVEGYTRRVKRWARRPDDSALGGERAGGGGYRASGGCGATAACATWSGPWTRWPRRLAQSLTWRRIDDFGRGNREFVTREVQQRTGQSPCFSITAFRAWSLKIR